MSDLVERLRAVQAGDYDTHGTLRVGARTICDVSLIRDASDMAEMCHDAAAEIVRLLGYVDAFRREEARADALAERLDGAEAERDALRAEVERLTARALWLERAPRPGPPMPVRDLTGLEYRGG
jgi:hypothetical protein